MTKGIIGMTRKCHWVFPFRVKISLRSRLGGEVDWTGFRCGATLANVGKKEALG